MNGIRMRGATRLANEVLAARIEVPKACSYLLIFEIPGDARESMFDRRTNRNRWRSGLVARSPIGGSNRTSPYSGSTNESSKGLATFHLNARKKQIGVGQEQIYLVLANSSLYEHRQHSAPHPLGTQHVTSKNSILLGGF